MGQVSVAYICDAGRTLGLGHLSRGRALLAHIPGRLVVGGDAGDSLLRDLGVDAIPWATATTPFDPSDRPGSVVVVDHYGLPESWIAQVSSRGPVAVIDDWKRPSTAAHMLVNPNIGAQPEFYVGRSAHQSLCGAEYSMIRPEILNAGRPTSNPARKGRIVLTLGGGTSRLDWTEVARELLDRVPRLRFLDIVLGPAADPAVLLTDLPRAGVAVHHAPPDLARLSRGADVVICSASTTSHEMAYLETAFVPVVTVDNQERIGRGWEEAGVAPYLTIEHAEFVTQLAAEVGALLADDCARVARAKAGRALVDGKGGVRIAEALRALALEYRGNAE